MKNKRKMAKNKIKRKAKKTYELVFIYFDFLLFKKHILLS